MSAGRLAEVLAQFTTCGERYCDTFERGNPNCTDCVQLAREAATVVADWLRSDEVREVVAEAIHASLDAPDSAAGDWGDLHEHIRNGWRAHAEDALRALVARALGGGK